MSCLCLHEGGCTEFDPVLVGFMTQDCEHISPGFSGTIGGVRLMDLIQLACLAQLSHTIALESAAGTGSIHIRSGQVVHAATGQYEGEAALFEMLQWEGGRFQSAPSSEDVAATLNRNWEYLLMEALRLSRQTTEASQAEEPSIAGKNSAHGTFQGFLEGIQWVDVIQLSCDGLLDREILVQSGEKQGRVFVRGGLVSHALSGEIQGEEAFYEMFRWPGGSFEAVASDKDEPVTIRTPWEYLLMEAMRIRDESPGDSREDQGREVASFAQKLQKMKVAEKIKLAMLGDKEARTLLIRDPSRIIQMAVINNPRITDGEVTAIANTKTVDEEVLKRITRSREWMKTYSVRLALTKNPKTPLNIASKLIPTLQPQDLKIIAKSKAVPTAIALAARRHLTQ